MTKSIHLQDLIEGVREAVIREWYVKENQTVTKTTPLLAFETAKAIMEAPASFDGKIIQLYCQPGDKVSAEQILLTIQNETT